MLSWLVDSFPDFNIRSSPLLILVLQGLVFIGLLVSRYFRNKNQSDLLLALILLIVCYEQICYTVGFMGWYHAFQNTKINYWLIPMGLALAPMIYLYVRSITIASFRLHKKDFLHFIPAIAIILYRVFIYTYDSLQPEFANMQNGILKRTVDEPIFQPMLMFTEFALMLLYLAFTFQMYYQYRKKISHFYSNTYRYELNWIRNFLLVFSLLFVYESIQDVIGALITDLHYTQRWWLNLLMAIAVIYVGVKGYFTDTSKLKDLSFDSAPAPVSVKDIREDRSISAADKSKLEQAMTEEKPYLNPELNLADLAAQTGMNRAQLSQLINVGFRKNFNDFVNEYRIAAVKAQFMEGKHEQLSLLGIAYECGFNSKATFNRVFKKLTHTSPSEYLKSG